jgi:hypothetical protein
MVCRDQEDEVLAQLGQVGEEWGNGEGAFGVGHKVAVSDWQLAYKSR